MKMLTFVDAGVQKLGVVTDKGVLKVEAAAAALSADAATPLSVMGAIEGGAAASGRLGALADRAVREGDASLFLQEDQLEWGPCVTRPSKIICVGLNYRKHAEESNMPIPSCPILFNKFDNTLTGHLKDVAVPQVTEKMDYEAELAVVIGRPAKYVSRDEALDYVYGYCCVNDLSARDLQMKTHQWLTGKTCDGFSPLGPYLVTADEVGNPNDLGIRAYVNGELRQNSNTADMIFFVDEIVSYVSQYMTLEPGDIILTGTPEGVVFGYPPEKQVYLKPGDEITIEIDKLGALTNRLIEESGRPTAAENILR